MPLKPTFNRFRIVVVAGDKECTILPTNTNFTPKQYNAMVEHFSKLNIIRWLSLPVSAALNRRSTCSSYRIEYEIADNDGNIRAHSVTISASGRIGS